jgi:hypothetical protein
MQNAVMSNQLDGIIATLTSDKVTHRKVCRSLSHSPALAHLVIAGIQEHVTTRGLAAITGRCEVAICSTGK